MAHEYTEQNHFHQTYRVAEHPIQRTVPALDQKPSPSPNPRVVDTKNHMCDANVYRTG